MDYAQLFDMTREKLSIYQNVSVTKFSLQEMMVSARKVFKIWLKKQQIPEYLRKAISGAVQIDVDKLTPDKKHVELNYYTLKKNVILNPEEPSPENPMGFIIQVLGKNLP